MDRERVKKIGIVGITILFLLLSLSPIVFAPTYWERNHRSNWLLGCDKLDARVRIYTYGSDANFNFTLTEKTSSEYFGMKVVNNHCYGWNGSEWKHLTNAPNGVGDGIINPNTWYELKISCDDGYDFTDIFVELFEYHSQQNLGWFYVDWHGDDMVNLDDEWKFEFNYESGDIAIDRFAVNTGQKWIGTSTCEWQECFLSDEFEGFESWNIDANYTLLEHGAEISSGCIQLYMGADAPESPEQTSIIPWWEQMQINLWATFQATWEGVRTAILGIPLFGDFIASAWSWIAMGWELVTALWGIFLGLIPFIPLIAVFYVLDMGMTSVNRGSITPLGDGVVFIYGIVMQAINLIINAVGKIRDFIHFW